MIGLSIRIEFCENKTVR